MNTKLLMLAFVTSASIAFAQTTTTYYGCVDKNGNLTIVSQATACKAGSSRIQWNDAGPPGPKGDKGDPGAGAMLWVDSTGAVIGPAFVHSGAYSGYWKTDRGYFAFNVNGDGTTNIPSMVAVYATGDCAGPAYLAAPNALGPQFPNQNAPLIGAPQDVHFFGANLAFTTGLYRVRLDQPAITQYGSARYPGMNQVCVSIDPIGNCSGWVWLDRGACYPASGVLDQTFMRSIDPSYLVELVQPFSFYSPLRVQ